jgi:hypothetical protein
MDISGSFRFLSMATALLLWVGAMATADTTGVAEEPATRAEAAPADDAPDAGGDTPAAHTGAAV